MALPGSPPPLPTARLLLAPPAAWLHPPQLQAGDPAALATLPLGRPAAGQLPLPHSLRQCPPPRFSCFSPFPVHSLSPKPPPFSCTQSVVLKLALSQDLWAGKPPANDKSPLETEELPDLGGGWCSCWQVTPGRAAWAGIFPPSRDVLLPEDPAGLGLQRASPRQVRLVLSAWLLEVGPQVHALRGHEGRAVGA